MAFYHYLNYFLNVLNIGYAVFVPILLVGMVILKKNREVLTQVLSTINCWFCLFGFCTLATWMFEILDEWHLRKTSGFEFYYTKHSFFHPWVTVTWWGLMLLCCILFLFKKWQRKIWLTSFAYLTPYCYAFIGLLITMHRDYLPGSWAFYYTPPWWEHKIVLLAIYVLIIGSTFYTCRQFGKKKLLSRK